MDVGGLIESLIDQLLNDWPSLLENPFGLYIVSMVFIIGVMGISLYRATEKHG